MAGDVFLMFENNSRCLYGHSIFCRCDFHNGPTDETSAFLGFGLIGFLTLYSFACSPILKRPQRKTTSAFEEGRPKLFFF